jgi:zinc protease
VLIDVPRSPEDTDALVKLNPEHTPEFEKEQAWRATPPKTGPERALVLPKPSVFMLPNGLTVYLVERHDLPIANVQLMMLAGTAANPPDRPGLAGLTAAMLTEGTAKRSADEIATQAALLGTELTTDSGSDTAQLSISLLSPYIRRGLELLADSAEHPAFPAADLDRIRANRLTSILQEEDDPFQLALRAGVNSLFGRANSYGYDALGTADSLHAITRTEVMNFHVSHYGPKESLLELTGDITPTEARKMAEEVSGTGPPL